MDQENDVWNWDDGMAPDCAVDGGIEAPIDTDGLRGKLTPEAPLAKLVWFKSGGKADWLFEPADMDDLKEFLRRLDGDLPIMALGLGSNMIVRDGGVPGVVIKLGKQFADVSIDDESCIVECGGGAHGILVASAARDCGVAGLEFMRGIPGTVGGFVRMNGGAYGREVSDVLIDCTVVMPGGQCHTLPSADLQYSYRHSALPKGAVVVSARFQGAKDDPEAIGVKMDEIADARENSQPLRTKTGGSTFKNPPGRKAWELVDAAGCRGLTMGGAQVSEKHTNFLINIADATSADIEGLGEEVRRRVYANSGVELEWEIQRVGRP
jgi:UDP-N-acetylmuramate dehydrogenase